MRVPVVFALLAVLAAPVAATTIAEVLDQGASLKDQTVTVVGTVRSPSLAYGGETAYDLEDGGRRISIFGRNAAPAPGEQLSVTGRVGFKAPDEEFTWPPVLVESARTPAAP